MERRSVTSRYHGSKIFGSQQRELRQQRGRRQRERQECNKFILVKQQLCTYITLFCIFFSYCCTTSTWNFLITRGRFTVNTTQKVSFSISRLRYGSFGFNPENFSNIWQMKWNWIRSNDEVWNSANLLFKWIFGFVVISKFCYHGNVA